MGGLGLLILFIIYVSLNIKLVHYVWSSLSKPVSILLTLIIVALPFTDAMIGRAYLKVKCEEGNHIVVNRSIPNIEGIFSYTGTSEDAPTYYGYKFVEEKGDIAGKGVRRATESGDPKAAIIEKDVQKQALYGLWSEGRSETFWFDEERYTIHARGYNPEELGGFTWYSFRGGLAERIMMAFSDAGPSSVAQCGDYEKLHLKIKELLHATLQPA
jgi:hypothetical protein